MAPHKPLAPAIVNRYPIPGTNTNQTAVGGFWMTGPNMKATLTMRNGLKTDPLTVTPVLYLSNGVRYALPAVILAPTMIAIVDINQGLAQQGVAPYATLSGYVELDYQWAWPIVCAMVKSVDTVHSVIFNYGMTAPLNAAPSPGRIASPGLTHNFEGMWWKQEANVTGFVALSNITGQTINATMEVTDDKESDIGDHTISVSPHGTKVVSLSELSTAASTIGGLYLTFTGPEHGLVVNGALEDDAVGYSARLPINILPQAPAAGQPPAALEVSFAELGLMNGAADPMMNFPVGTIFTPYSVVRNVSNQVAMATPTVWWMAGGTSHSASLPQITLSAHQTFSLNVPAMLASAELQNYNGSLNLTLDTKATHGGLVFAGGSVDQKNTYVFEVLPSGFGESSAKTISNWSTGNGDDTMVTVWNPADEAQDFTFTLFYAGGQYLHPIHLEPRATLVFDVSELTRTPTPDAAGNVVPSGIFQGSAEISGTQSEQEHILVAMDVGIYNVQKATCNGICPTCMGFTSGSIALNPFAVPIGGQTQETLYMQMGSGGQNSVAATNWASTNTSMATVSSGMVTGVGVGSPTVSSNSQSEEFIFVPFDCNEICPSGFVAGSTPGNVTQAPHVTFSGRAAMSQGGTTTIMATVTTGNTVPITLTLPSSDSGSAVFVTGTTTPSTITITNTTTLTIKGISGNLEPGAITLTAKVAEGSSQFTIATYALTVVALSVKFTKSGSTSALPSPFRLGISSTVPDCMNNPVTHDRTQTIQAIVSPPWETPNIGITDNRASNGATLTFKITETDDVNGIITMTVVGTAQSANQGDVQIIATDTLIGSQFTLPISVIVPSQIATPHQSGSFTEPGVNIVSSVCTSPAAEGIPTGDVSLLTDYEVRVTVTVWDQFGTTVGDLYTGASVSETNPVSGLIVPINQNLTSGSSYTDPVGPLQVGTAAIAASDPAVAAWPSHALLPLQTQSGRPILPVQVDGFPIGTISTRAFSSTPPHTVVITWP